MNKSHIEAPQNQTRRFDFYLLSTCIVLLFLVAPLFTRPHIGGWGLELPFNIAAWGVAGIVIFIAVWMITNRHSIRLPRHSLYLNSFPLVIMLSAVITEPVLPISFFYRELYIVGGVLFFFSLFQFKLINVQVEWILLLIVLSTLAHSIVGIMQINFPELLKGLILGETGGRPSGLLQQINVQVSFLTTGIAIAFYLISRPIAKRFNFFTSAFLLLSVQLNSFVIFYSGSRLGLLSLGLILVLFLVRYRQLLKNKALVIIAILAIINGAVLGQSGFERAFDKWDRIAQGFGINHGMDIDTRIHMYSIAFELVSQKPIVGHGFGSFLRVWNLQSSDYISRNPDAVLPLYTTHPHNELLFWGIEGGIISILGILAAAAAVVMALIKCGAKRASGYIAMLLPITLHTQVELPFYISSIHWFLWLFLIYAITNHQSYARPAIINVFANRSIQLIGVVLLLGSFYFLEHSARAQADIYNYRWQKSSATPYLESALSNHYFRYQAEGLAMRGSLYNAVASNDLEQIKSYIAWSENRIETRPELQLFKDLISANDHLNGQKAKCHTIKRALKMYAQYVPFQHLRQSCPY